jgi:DNA-binding MarR family transcriptional regulator
MKKSVAKIPPKVAAMNVGAVLEQMETTLTAAAEGRQADPIQGNSDVLVSQWKVQFGSDDITPLTVAIRMRRLAMLIDEISSKECDAAGIKLNDMLLMMALRRVGNPYALRPTDILKMHSVTSGTVTYRIDQLTKQDLAERVPDPHDRRGYLVRLTPRGLKIIDSILHRMLDAWRENLRPMTAVPGAMVMLEESLRLYERCISEMLE